MTPNIGMRVALILATGLSSICAAPALADTVLIKVLDEGNKGVQSRVLYTENAAIAVLGDTNGDGILNREYQCKVGQTITARPYDIGNYFESRAEPCASEIMLRVVRRQTSKGPAIQYRIVPFKFQDGSAGVITYRAVLETALTDTNTAVASCDVKINTIVDQQVFRVSSNIWLPVNGGNSGLSDVMAGAGIKDTESTLLPFDCKASASRIEQFKTGTAKQIGFTFDAAEFATGKTLTKFGIQ